MYRRGEIVVDSVPTPIPGPGQILVKTLVCGICGSDLHFRHHAHRFVDVALRSGVSAMAADLGRDIVLGHEFCAEVLEYGPQTQRLLKPGSTVCSPPLGFGSSGPRAIGYSHELPGGFGQYMLLNEPLVLPVPNGLRPWSAALTEPMAVGWHAVQIAALRKDHIPLVIGCGPVGLAVIAALKRQNAGPIIAADFSAGRRDLAIRMGADVAVDPSEGSPYSEWGRVSRIEDYDGMAAAAAQSKTCLIFECVGVPGMLRQVMEGAFEGSEVIVVGACMEPDSFEPMMALYKALTLKFSRTYTGEEFAAVLQMIGDGSLNVEPLVTPTIGLDAVPGVFEALARPEAQAKVLIDPWQ